MPAQHRSREQKKGAKLRSLIYAYCIIDSNQAKNAQEPLVFQGKDESRLGFGPPYLIPFGDISAVVSKVPQSKFNQSAIDKNTKDLKWLSDAATKHEDLVESIMTNTTPVPLKLCTIFNSEDRVRFMLKQNYAKFSSDLNDLRGAVELGVNAYVSLDFNKLASYSQSDQIKKKKREISNASEGKAYFLRQDLQEMLVSDFASKAYSTAKTIYEDLRGLAARSRIVSPIRSDLLSEEKAHPSKEMIMNSSFLVRNERIDEFKEKYEEINRHLPEGISLKLTGPWPPYNFVE
jgi:hypothetical protein